MPSLAHVPALILSLVVHVVPAVARHPTNTSSSHFTPTYNPPSPGHVVVAGLTDTRSSRLASSTPTLDTSAVPITPAKSSTASMRDVRVAAVVPLASLPTSTPDPLEDAIRELVELSLRPDPLRLAVLERRVAELRDLY
ncbi:hypothetical protein GGX14DRAFT_573406 [Mycena pura]|uniref:Uncharacterized protein n=1 Tax=Mycena pura TaxID=153505 RepID=A0AAD6V6H5_9AGAR|nr:hypothetical protein GGX14DRAFT_573406 [Mycena pura]